MLILVKIWKQKWWIMYTLGLILIAFIVFYCGLVIREYDVKSDKITKPIKVVLISDLHSNIYGKDQKNLIKAIKDQKPDLILLTGDIIDDKAPTKGAEKLLEGIKDICKVYYVRGNHEARIKDKNQVKNIINKYGITMLDYEYEEIVINENKLVIAGIIDKEYGFDTKTHMQKNFKELENIEGYKILLAHRPEFIEEYKKYSFDLIVSGHTHGGQVRIPYLLNGLYAPNQGWLPKYAGGEYIHEGLTHIISRGLYRGWPRVFNPPELVVINIDTL